jgi:hypothetical protein
MAYFVGITPKYKREVFNYYGRPTVASHGDYYNLAIGPFSSKLAAELMAVHGEGNPHMQHTSDCNRLAKKGRVWLRSRGFRV